MGILQPVFRPLFSPIMRRTFRDGASGGASAPSLTAQVQALFASGEQGAWYDPSDFSTMFQDSAGTTPVTAVEQPVGLMLDKRLGLARGPEIVVNGDFTSGTTGWTGTGAGVTISSVAGRLRLETAFANGHATQTVPTVAGRAYEISFVWWGTSNPSSNTLASFSATISPALNATSPAPGTRIRFIAYAAAASTSLQLSARRERPQPERREQPAQRPSLQRAE